MTNDEIIAVIKAYETNYSSVEYRRYYSEQWLTPYVHLGWDFINTEWRIKPKLEEVAIV